MNRTQRRSGQKPVNTQMYTAGQVQHLLRIEGKKMLEQAVNDYSAVVAWCLLDKLGFKHKRSKRFLIQVSEMFEHIQDDRLSIEDIKKELEEQVGVIIK